MTGEYYKTNENISKRIKGHDFSEVYKTPEAELTPISKHMFDMTGPYSRRV